MIEILFTKYDFPIMGKKTYQLSVLVADRDILTLGSANTKTVSGMISLLSGFGFLGLPIIDSI